jgi:hypothetical protein
MERVGAISALTGTSGVDAFQEKRKYRLLDFAELRSNSWLTLRLGAWRSTLKERADMPIEQRGNCR